MPAPKDIVLKPMAPVPILTNVLREGKCADTEQIVTIPKEATIVCARMVTVAMPTTVCVPPHSDDAVVIGSAAPTKSVSSLESVSARHPSSSTLLMEISAKVRVIS